MVEFDCFDFELKKNRKTFDMFDSISQYLIDEEKYMNDTIEYEFIIDPAFMRSSKIEAIKAGESIILNYIPLFRYTEDYRISWVSSRIQDIFRELIIDVYMKDERFLEFYEKYRNVFDALFTTGAEYHVSEINTLPCFIALFFNKLVAVKFMAWESRNGVFALVEFEDTEKPDQCIHYILDRVLQ